MNDVWHGTTGVPLDHYQQNITKTVERCQAAGVKVMILTATMQADTGRGVLNAATTTTTRGIEISLPKSAPDPIESAVRSRAGDGAASPPQHSQGE